MKPNKLSDIGVLILRVVLAVVILYYGSQKMLGAFGGPGISGTLSSFKKGSGFPEWLTMLAIISEFCGGIAVLFGCRVIGVGRKNVPDSGPLIVAPNHMSNLDPFAVACGTNRHLRFMAKEELFHSKFVGGLIGSLGAFPVKRGESDTEAIRKAM